MSHPERGQDGDNASFTWINIARPSDVWDEANRRQIRSFVTKLQHRRGRKQRHGGARRKDQRDGSFSRTATPGGEESNGQPDQNGDVCARADLSTAVSRVDGVLATGHPPASSAYDGDERSAEIFQSEEDKMHSAPGSKAPSPTGTWANSLPMAREETTPSPSLSLDLEAMSFRTFGLHDSRNAVGPVLHALGLDLTSVLSLYKHIAQFQARDFNYQYQLTPQRGPSGSRFFPLIFTDPVLLSAALLLGVRNQLDALHIPIAGRTATQIVHLETFLLQNVNAALSDPDLARRTRDTMLAAVALCAAYDAKHAHGRAQHVHMQGLVRMIRLRGGLAALGSPEDMYLARWLVWIDTNISKLSGRRAYLLEMVGEGEKGMLCPRANLGAFCHGSGPQRAGVGGKG